MAKSEQVVSKRSSFRDRHDEGMTAGIQTDVLDRLDHNNHSSSWYMFLYQVILQIAHAL